MSPLAWVGFVAAAAVGAPLRYVVGQVVDGLVEDRVADRAADRVDGAFPWGTLLVNATGSAVLGFLTGLALYHAFPKTPRVILGTGFCGAYTTFSTFTFETLRLVEDGDAAAAFGNVLATVLVCAGAAALGLALATL